MDNTISNERITDLESMFGHFMNVTTKSISELKKEMKAFAEEAERDRKKRDAEMKDFKDEMRGFKDEMKDFKDEMRGFKDEMKDDHKRMNKQWGELSNKLGTIVEDLIAPAVRPVVKKYFDEDIVDFSLNRKKHDKSINLRGEFDVIAASETTVYLVEVKATFREEYLDRFTGNIEKFKKLFPEFNNLKLVPIFASIRFDDELFPKITQYGFYALAYRDWDYMDILNFEDINKS